MKLQPCRWIQQRLAAYHDGELAVGERTTVRTHLEACASCSAEASCLVSVSEAVKAVAEARATRAVDPTAHLPASVVTRSRVEAAQSLPARLRGLKEERHLWWAAFGATMAAFVWAAVAAGVLHFVAPVRADSLAGILTTLASPGSNENPYRPDARIRMPRVTAEGLLPGLSIGDLPGSLNEEDLVFALAAVVTREGRVTDLSMLLSNDQRQEAVLRVLSAASTARFEPARFGTTPVAVSLVWLVTRTTVRGKLNG